MTVVRLGEADLARAAEVVGDGFFADPLLAYAIPDDDDRRTLAPAHFLPVARLAFQVGEVWWDGDAVACWLPPGHHDATEDEAVAAGLDRMADHVGAEPAARLDGVFDHLRERRLALGVPDHWYLALLGVRTSAQGRGLGGAVIAPRLALADEAGEWCFLETLGERNVPFYERHGFDLVESGVEPGSGLPYWMLLRRPR
ncbi:MAG TPA: GNAT family N-acetyltransferase [Frankiaceae bacterium]|nr:GNAT family N-acetyltransferase [Frankiaceae bacterium]